MDQFLSYAELQTMEQNPVRMADWVRKLDQFIGELNEKPVLTNAGTVSRLAMETKVRREFEAYRSHHISNESLSEEEFERRLTDAGAELLPAPTEETDQHSDESA